MNKFILVPQEMYRGLTDPDNYADNINLENVRAKMENLKKSKNLKTSAKNVLVNQQRRRYLKMRRDIQEKPIKVQFDQPEKILTEKTVQTVKGQKNGNEGENEVLDLDDDPVMMQKNIKKVPEKTRKYMGRSNIRYRNIHASSKNISKKGRKEVKVPFSAPGGAVQHNETEDDTADGDGLEAFRNETLFQQTPNRFGVTKGIAATRNESPYWKQSPAAIKIREIMDYVKRNEYDLKVKGNRVLTHHYAPIEGSNLAKSIQIMLNPEISDAPPPGHEIIVKRLINDRSMKQFLGGNKEQSGDGITLFKPTLWSF